MIVEFTALRKNFELYKEEYEEATLRALHSGWYILGPELEAFEREFAEYIGSKFCIGMNSGTDALILGIRALGIGPGDEVIVPGGTYIASVLGITENGAIPIYIDSNEYKLINVDDIRKNITNKTKAIVVVHMYGQACNMSEIMEIAKEFNLKVIEDCAQCHGAKWNNKMTGTFGDIGCFSFYPTKPLGAFGDAGAVVTNNSGLAEKLRMLRNYGSKVKYQNEMVGVNSRLDEVQAANLRVGLKHLDEMNSNRIDIAKLYLSRIDNEIICLPKTDERATNVFHLFPIIVDDQEKFQKYMLENGVKTQIHYPVPPYVAECYKEQGHTWEEYPQASYIARHEVSLPIYSGILKEEVEYVISLANNYS